MSMGSLTAELQVNGADVYTSEMIRVADATQHTTVIVHEQRAAWSQLAASAIPAIGSVTSAGLSLAGTLAVINHQKTMIASVAAPLLASGNALYQFGMIGLRVGAMVVPQLKAISLAASTVAVSWKAVNSEFSKEVYQKTLHNLDDEMKRISKSSKGLQSDLSKMVSDPLTTWPLAIRTYAEDWHLAERASKSATNMIQNDVRNTASVLEYLSSAAREARQTLSAVFYTVGAGKNTEEDAFQFLKQGQELEVMRVNSDKLTKSLLDQSKILQVLANAQDQASAESVYAADRERIARIDNLKSLQDELSKQQQEASHMGKQGVGGEFGDWLIGQQASLFQAIESQRRLIKSGHFEQMQQAPIKAILDQARNAIDLARGGQEEFAFGTLMANGATAEQVKQLRDLQAELKTFTAAQEAANLAEEARAAAEQQQNQLREQGAQRIAALKDQVDLLTKSATAADIAMREMTRQGFTMDQVAEVGRLTGQIDELQKKSETQTAARSVASQAALRGSQEAASLLLRGVGGKSMEQIAQKQLTATQQLIAAVKSNKPDPMMIVDF